jgi:hypothetical protein
MALIKQILDIKMLFKRKAKLPSPKQEYDLTALGFVAVFFAGIIVGLLLSKVLF